MFTVTLKNGTPQVYISETSVLRPKKEYTLNDDSWHHIAVSMPKGSCALSEVVMHTDDCINNSFVKIYNFSPH